MDIEGVVLALGPPAEGFEQGDTCSRAWSARHGRGEMVTGSMEIHDFPLAESCRMDAMNNFLSDWALGSACQNIRYARDWRDASAITAIAEP